MGRQQTQNAEKLFWIYADQNQDQMTNRNNKFEMHFLCSSRFLQENCWVCVLQVEEECKVLGHMLISDTA